MDIDIKDQQYFCNKIQSEVIISLISDLEIEGYIECKKLSFHSIDCDHRNVCGIVQLSNGDKSVGWRKCVHPELNGYGKMKN